MKNKTIAEFVVEDYRTADLFYKYGIDFCCGGKKLLSDVCREKNIEQQDIINELEKISSKLPEIDYTSMTAEALIAHIESQHHSYIRMHAPIILQYLNKINQVHGSRHPELQEIYDTFLALAEELDIHLQKEENILFPYIRSMSGNTERLNMPFTSVNQPITMMESEHDAAGNALKKIKTLTQDYMLPSDACNTYRIAFEKLKDFEHDLHKHVHLENNILFQKAILLEQEI